MAAQALRVVRREHVLTLLAAAYILFRVIGFIGAEPRIFPDTGTYEHVAHAPILSIDFRAGWRAPTLPLLYKVVTGNEARIWAQLAISIVCWLALAIAVAATIGDRRLRPLAFGAVLLFALAPEIVLWDAALLSESVSLSLTAALTAGWLWIARRPSPWAYGVVLVLTAAWALARDPHAYVVVGLALVLAVSVGASRDWGGPRYLRAATAVGLVAIAAASFASADTHFARWAFPLQNLIALRISTEPDQLAYFQDAGMPVTPELLAAFESQREGTTVLGPPSGSDSPERLSGATPFHRWLLTQGRSTYTQFLLTHPLVVAEGLDHLGETLLDPEVVGYSSGGSPWSGGLAAAAIYPRRTEVAIAWLALAVGMAAFVALRFGGRREWLVPAFLIAASLPFAIIVYHGEQLELDRHGLVPSVFLRLGVLLLFLFALDRWLQARHEPQGNGSPGERGLRPIGS